MNEIISTQIAFWLSLSFFSLGASGALLLRKKDELSNLWSGIFSVIGSIFGLLTSLKVLFFDNGFSFVGTSSFPLLSLSFSVDYLAAFFIGIISLVSLLCSIYSIGYVRHYYGKYNIGTLGFFYNLFIAGMILVVSSSNGLLFLVAWEIMSLASYFLVSYERKKQENIKAGFLYFVMTHVGTAFIILLFLLLYKFTGSLEFSEIKNNISSVPNFIKTLVFIFAIIGFGTKAGIIPLHIWLPSAHPAAPSHVSALMSGVMIKTGIYMFIRIFFDFFPVVPLWLGASILIIGSISSLLGVLYALSEHDIKKLLAYHSIENIGIILLGLGSALIFSALNFKFFAALGLIAALFHTLNHATFKSLLFLGAGAVISKTHTRNIEEYGGLIKLMPFTALFFLVGAMAISALPPFNGFFSEWVTYQSLFYGIVNSDLIIRGLFILAAGSLAFTGGLAAACFVKAFGATFLARPRSEEAKHATEISFSLKFAMAGLAILTAVFGFFAGSVSSVMSKITDSIGLASSETASIFKFQSVTVNQGFAAVSMPYLFFGIISVVLIVAIFVWIVSRRQQVKEGITWNCGGDLSPRMEITATSFSRSLILIFKGLLKPTKQTDVEYHDEKMRYFRKISGITLETVDVYKKYFYNPLSSSITKVSEKVKLLQSGNLNAYLLYIFIVLLSLLILFVI